MHPIDTQTYLHGFKVLWDNRANGRIVLHFSPEAPNVILTSLSPDSNTVFYNINQTWWNNQRQRSMLILNTVL